MQTSDVNIKRWMSTDREPRDQRAPREKNVVDKILHHINSHSECYAMKVHGDEYTVNQPDIVGSWYGRALAIECKRPGKGARRGQAFKLERWFKTGAIVGVARSVDEFKRLIEEFDSGRYPEVHRDVRGNQDHRNQAYEGRQRVDGENHTRSGDQRRRPADANRPERRVGSVLRAPASKVTGVRCSHVGLHYILEDGATGCLQCEHRGFDDFDYTPSGRACPHCQSLSSGYDVTYPDDMSDYLCSFCHQFSHLKERTPSDAH